MMLRRFHDRADAGRLLAQQLMNYAGRSDVLILALPRGGVPVGFAVAQALQAPLDVVVVRKLGVPHQPELAMGALAMGGVRVLNDEVVTELRIARDAINRVAEREQAELERRERVYRRGRPAPLVRGRVVILVDDGLATGTTMHVAVAAVRTQQPAWLLVAVPVAASDSVAALGPLVDDLVWVIAPKQLYAIGRWYENFAPTTDVEVCDLLERSATLPTQAFVS
ncbi:MAG TPA: phosphoribosyltransferase family protein [Roseiflexaceae bacterium]|nr:phosphoribosyltransferase family protein [Roseiflexaceae bacterium]